MRKIKHPVDDLFRDSLQDYQVHPSDTARHRLLDEAEAIMSKERRFRWRWFLLLAGLIVVVTVATVIWQDGEDAGSTQPAVGSGQSVVRSEGSEVTGGKSEAGGVVEQVGKQGTEVSVDTKTTEHPELSDQLTERSSSENIQDPIGPSTVQSGLPIIAASSQGPTDAEEPVAEEQTDKLFPPTLPFPDTVNQMDPTVSGDSVTPDATVRSAMKPAKRQRSSSWQFATSVYYFPEWMFNTLEGDKFVSNLGVEESFRFDRYLLRTGIGLSIAKGTNELMVEYNDYLGTYNQLDSIRFSWDEKNYHLLPTYYLSDKDVWDSLMQLDYPKVVKRYTYIQVPLILGYDVVRHEKFSLGFRAGPVLSVLVNSRTLTDDYDPGKNKIIRINQVTPDRIQTNWQIQGGINLSLPLSRRIGFEIEPTFKYYFNSVYEKSDAMKKPWSVGFRASFTIFH